MFPIIRNISDIKHVIDSREEIFMRADEEHGIIAVSYMVSMPETFMGDDFAIKRECRGAIFDLETGDIRSRSFHKFFNVNEKEESQLSAIDFTRPHTTMLKLDGSMVHPVLTKKGLKLATKKGITRISEKATLDLTEGHKALCLEMIEARRTPIFEWITPANRIVVSYGEPDLILLAVRDNITGEYASYDELTTLGSKYGVKVVTVYDAVVNPNEWLQYVNDIDDEGIEGFVIAFEDGSRYKAKTELYRNRHNSLDLLRFEKDVVNLVVDDKIDDVIPVLSADMAAAIERYRADFLMEINKRVKECEAIAAGYVNNGLSRKDTAVAVTSSHPHLLKWIMHIYANLVEGETNHTRVFEDMLRAIYIKSFNSTLLDSMRFLFADVNWYDYVPVNAFIDSGE